MIMHRRWEHPQKQRYYRILLGQDLFGQWMITKVWGGINQANGKVTHQACLSYDEAMQYVEQISKRRLARGYQVTLGCESQ